MQGKTGLGFVAGGLLAFSSGAHGQGYFPFDEIPGLDSEPTVQIDLDPELMNMFGAAARGADRNVASALEGITNVRVRVYEGIGDSEVDLVKFVDDTSRRLERDGWKSVVRVNEDGERVRIFVKLAAGGGANAGSFEGLTVMVVDTGGGDEAVFINVAGDIQPERLGRIASGIGMNGMFDMIPGVPATGPNGDL